MLDVLVTEREAALTEATRLRNQGHQLLLQVDPDYRVHFPSLASTAGVRVVETYTCVKLFRRRPKYYNVTW